MASLESKLSFEIPCPAYEINLRALEVLYRTLCDALQIKDRSRNYYFISTIQYMKAGDDQVFYLDENSSGEKDAVVRIIAKEKTIDVQVLNANGYSENLRRKFDEYLKEEVMNKKVIDFRARYQIPSAEPDPSNQSSSS